MRAADYIVDIGPGAGVHGGEVICAGTLDDIMKCEAFDNRTVSYGKIKDRSTRKAQKAN